MPLKQCCQTCKEHIFSDKNRVGSESRLKENVVYHRSYTFRPTVKLSGTSITKTYNKSLSKTDSSIKPESIVNNRTSTKAKPVIESEPRPINSQQVHKTDIRSRSASLPAIPSRFKLISDGSKTTPDTSPTRSSAVMNQIRRRVSQIFDSHLLSDNLTTEPPIDSQAIKTKCMQTINKRLNKKRQREGAHRKTSTRTDAKSKSSGDSSDQSDNRRQPCSTKENQRKTKTGSDRHLRSSQDFSNKLEKLRHLQSIDSQPNIKIDRKMKGSGDLSSKSIDKRLIEGSDKESNLKIDEKLTDSKTKSNLSLRDYYIGLSRNSLSLIQNCYRD